MKNFQLALLLFLTISYTACITPYQAQGLLGGYSEAALGDDKFFITVNGNGNTHQTILVSYLTRRAKELCESKGYKKSEISQLSVGGNTYNNPGYADTNCTSSGNSASCQTTNYAGNTVTKHVVTGVAACSNI